MKISYEQAIGWGWSLEDIVTEAIDIMANYLQSVGRGLTEGLRKCGLIVHQRVSEGLDAAIRTIDQRDRIASRAMQAAISGHIAHYGHDNHWLASDIASHAYELADAMLAARTKGGAA